MNIVLFALVVMAVLQIAMLIELRALRERMDEVEAMAQASFDIGKAHGVVLVKSEAVSAEELMMMLEVAKKHSKEVRS
jgi:hypothetical protein